MSYELFVALMNEGNCEHCTAIKRKFVSDYGSEL